MIATEYFVAGTEPHDTCNLHVGRSLMGRVAGWFGAPASPTQRRSSEHAETAESAPPTASAAPVEPAPAAAAMPEPEKKRGFWSRIFGRKDGKEGDKPKKPASPRPR